MVAEVETDKTTVPVPSPAAGVILELLIPDGERVEAGSDLFKLQVQYCLFGQDSGVAEGDPIIDLLSMP